MSREVMTINPSTGSGRGPVDDGDEGSDAGMHRAPFCVIGGYPRTPFLFISLMQEKRNQRVHYPQGPLDRGMQLTTGRDRPSSGFW